MGDIWMQMRTWACRQKCRLGGIEFNWEALEMRMHTGLWGLGAERSPWVPGPGDGDLGRLDLSPQRPTLQQDKEKKKKESILDLSKYIDKTIRVKFQGGREGEWVLRGSLTQSLAEVTASKGNHTAQAFQ